MLPEATNKLIIFVLTAACAGCGWHHIDDPAPDEHERWHKPGATTYSTQQDLRECAPGEITSFEHLRRLDECMLRKGYEFIDPVRGRRKCDTPRTLRLPSCQSLNE